jgi:hypothetical protein
VFFYLAQQCPLKRPGEGVFLAAGETQSLKGDHDFADNIRLILGDGSVADPYRPCFLEPGEVVQHALWKISLSAATPYMTCTSSGCRQGREAACCAISVPPIRIDV